MRPSVANWANRNTQHIKNNKNQIKMGERGAKGESERAREREKERQAKGRFSVEMPESIRDHFGRDPTNVKGHPSGRNEININQDSISRKEKRKEKKERKKRKERERERERATRNTKCLSVCVNDNYNYFYFKTHSVDIGNNLIINAVASGLTLKWALMITYRNGARRTSD